VGKGSEIKEEDRMKNESARRPRKRRYAITVIAEVSSSLSRNDLEASLVLSLFDVENETKISDGDDERLEVENYEVTEAVPIDSVHCQRLQ